MVFSITRKLTIKARKNFRQLTMLLKLQLQFSFVV